MSSSFPQALSIGTTKTEPNKPQVTSNNLTVSVMYNTFFSLVGVTIQEKDMSISLSKINGGGSLYIILLVT